ncbi:class I SAM-dependent rRNA methyltransferase [Idiomarina xiamenensis]|uniref:PUA domain-containing protein n=1 Tax=Idiomarina xiamenensis 10-D-4 TaxID=740709 RepID=K2L4J8_9GAMM|nr:class I SAM-dependent methyltransferase [Idiomarina xiamenensis]EKE84745.1 hypothetical protein A10D4_04005 [Idiomarina xiamenensis 10-D-4]
MSAVVVLKSGKEKSLKRRHPWIFSGAIQTVKGKPASGDTVRVESANGEFLALAAYSPQSQIRARVWSFDANDSIDDEFFYRRIHQAQQLRQQLLSSDTNSYRVVAAESDELPGITIDRYDNYLVCQLLSAGAERWRGAIVNALKRCFAGCHIYERSDVDVRKKEGLPLVTGVLSGDQPPAEVIIRENGLQLAVDICAGHKTGYYLDQRDSRHAIMTYAAGKRVLNAFSYSGGFSIYAAAAGAREVINVDVSEPALATAQRNLALNNMTDAPVQQHQADVFQALRDYTKAGERFDVIVLDPPKFVDSKASLTRACRGYKDINRLAAGLLNPGGILLTFSCSGLLAADLFQKVVADAALDAGRPLKLVQRLYQAADHPVLLSYPEGLYLKGLVLRAD